MDGSWRIGPGRVEPHRIRIVLGTSDGLATGIDLGVLEVLERSHDQDVVAHLGPDLLGRDWDPRLAAANLAAESGRALSEALLDQRVMAGVGNVYANELCFVFGRRPTAEVGTIKDPLRLVQRARDMLWLNRSRTNRTTTGNTRSGQQLWVYGRAGEPCGRCGTPIEVDRCGDRISFWCPNCQAA
jgi:endonuclease-8